MTAVRTYDERPRAVVIVADSGLGRDDVRPGRLVGKRSPGVVCADS